MPTNYKTYPQNSVGPYFTNAAVGKPIHNNGSNIWYVGTPANTTFNPVPTKYLGYRSGISDNNPNNNKTVSEVVPALSNGQWQSMRAGKYVLLTFCSDLAGNPNTTLRFAASYGGKGGQNTMSQNFVRTPLYRSTGGWYYQTGQPVNRVDSIDSFNIQDGASPIEKYPGTRAVPGHLFFIAAGIGINGLPGVYSYKAKTD